MDDGPTPAISQQRADARRPVCSVLEHENAYSSAERMPCLGAEAKFLQCGREGRDPRVSKRLAANSITLPISNEIPLDTVETICSLVEAI